MPPKLYLLVRTDVDVAVQGVQLAHVAAVMSAINPRIDWLRTTFKVLQVENEMQLFNEMRAISKITTAWQVFKEPDLRNKVVAAAVLHDGDLFENLKLWDPLKDLEEKLRDCESSLFEERMGDDL